MVTLPPSKPPLAPLLELHRSAIHRFIQREAGVVLLRFDAPDDLLQGICADAIRAWDNFEWRGEAPFVGWLYEVARRHMSGRREYWLAAKRHAGRSARLALSGELGAFPADTATGPATFAARREILTLIARAQAMLPERDRSIIDWCGSGLTAQEQSTRLNLSRDAFDKARARAFDRLRKAFQIVSRGERR